MKKKCIVISTHQVKDLENLIDRVTVIDEGKILFDQTVDAISRKLSFQISFDSEEVKMHCMLNLLYAVRQSLHEILKEKKVNWTLNCCTKQLY